MERVRHLKKQLQDLDLDLDLDQDQDQDLQRVLLLLNSGINACLSSAAAAETTSSVRTNASSVSSVTAVKSELYLSGVLSHCLLIFSLDSSRLRPYWREVSKLTEVTSSCCLDVVAAADQQETFLSRFLPSLVDSLLSLAAQLIGHHQECVSVFRTVMDCVSRLLSAHPHLTSKVFSSVHYEHISMCDDITVILACINMWAQTCSISRNFLSRLGDDSLLLILNEAVGQLAVSSEASVGAAEVRLLLLMADQLQQLRLQPLLLSFKGLDRLLDKDWRGQGFDQDLDQLIRLVQSERSSSIRGNASQDSSEREHTAACVIQAAWRSYWTRRRVKSLSRVVSSLQRKYRARRRQQEQQKEAQRCEEELKYQMCLQRKQARRAFHEKQKQLLQLLPPAQVQTYLSECERRAAVMIQRIWRGYRERRRYNNSAVRTSLRQERAAVILQRVVCNFLQRRRLAKSTANNNSWVCRKPLTDSRRAELKKQVEEDVAVHPSSRVSREECQRLHEEVQLLLQMELQTGVHRRRREEQRVEFLLAHTHTLLEQLRDAPPLSAVTAADVESFLSPSGVVAARARDAHNAVLQAERLPWWKVLGEARETPDPSCQLRELEAQLGDLCVGRSGSKGRKTDFG